MSNGYTSPIWWDKIRLNLHSSYIIGALFASGRYLIKRPSMETHNLWRGCGKRSGRKIVEISIYKVWPEWDEDEFYYRCSCDMSRLRNVRTSCLWILDRLVFGHGATVKNLWNKFLCFRHYRPYGIKTILRPKLILHQTAFLTCSGWKDCDDTYSSIIIVVCFRPNNLKNFSLTDQWPRTLRYIISPEMLFLAQTIDYESLTIDVISFLPFHEAAGVSVRNGDR